MLPDNSHKLLAHWQGPFQITKKLGPVNYKVQWTSPVRRKQNYQVNFLKKWNERDAWLMQGGLESEDLDDPVLSEFTNGEPKIGKILSGIQKQELK